MSLIFVHYYGNGWVDQLSIERSRIDNLTTLKEGSTTGDAELQDIRVGVDSTIYENAGTAVRTQINKLSEKIGEIKESGIGGSGLTTDLKSAMKTYFTNMQVLIPQLAYVTEDNIGAVLISNAKAVVTALDVSGETGGESGGEEPEPPTEVTLTKISVAYIGGNVPVGTSVNNLTGITVTAIYSDGSTATVTNYTLSGEITEGSNVITVTYEGMTSTFVVTGVVETPEILYQLPSVTTFDGTNNIDTGVSLLSTDSDWTVVADLESQETGSEEWIFHTINVNSPWEQFGLARMTNKVWRVNFGTTQQHQLTRLGSTCPNIKIAITHATGNNYVDIKAIDKDGNYSGVYSGQCIYGSSPVFDGNIVIGSSMEDKKYWNGVANDFKIYSRVLSDDEISAYLV